MMPKMIDLVYVKYIALCIKTCRLQRDGTAVDIVV
jgi:hypothetical protein